MGVKQYRSSFLFFTHSFPHVPFNRTYEKITSNFFNLQRQKLAKIESNK